MERLKNAVKAMPLRYPYVFFESLLVRPAAQNDEEQILRWLVSHFQVPRVFVQFGFSGWEFNCASRARNWTGLLVAGDPYDIRIAGTIDVTPVP